MNDDDDDVYSAEEDEDFEEKEIKTTLTKKARKTNRPIRFQEF